MSSKRRSHRAAFSLFSFQDIITSITGIMILITLILAVELVSRTHNAPPAQTAQQIETTELSVEELKLEIASYRRELESKSHTYDNLPSLESSQLEHMKKDLEDTALLLQREIQQLRQHQAEKQKQLQESEQTQGRERQVKVRELAQLQDQVTDLKKRIASLGKLNRVFFESGVKDKTMWLIEMTAAGFTAAEIGIKARPTRMSSVSNLSQWLTSLDRNANAIYLAIKPSGVSNFELCKKTVQQHNLDMGFQVVGEQQQVIDSLVGAGGP